MKGIIKHNKKFYKKSRDKKVVKGDLIKLECKRKSDYFKFNGIYEVMDNSRCIHIKNYDEEGHTLGLKLGYNTFDYYKLVEVKNKKNLPMPVKEDEICGYTI